jgi:GntR family transcriptional regulator, transcriptional repressor for pyruvate dehydrogenase complex
VANRTNIEWYAVPRRQIGGAQHSLPAFKQEGCMVQFAGPLITNEPDVCSRSNITKVCPKIDKTLSVDHCCRMTDFQNQSRQNEIDQLLNAALSLTGTLLSTRDKLVQDIGLTSALWQVLNAVSQERVPRSAAQIARLIGLTRQAVQRTANDLVTSGMATFSDNPSDRRTQLIGITEQGKVALDTANDRQSAWLSTFGDALGGDTLEKAAEFMRAANAIALELPRRLRPKERAAREPMEALASALESAPRPQARKKRAFEKVSDTILSKIKDGSLAPGHKLQSERDLAFVLSVGRPAVREALRSLEMSGVLRFERGASGGAFVRETGSDGMALSIRNMLILGRLPLTDLLEVRATLLGQCARLGTDRATTHDLDRLESNIDELEERIQAVEDQVASIGPATDFYRLAARAAHNPLMVMLVDAIADLVAEMLASLHHWPRLDAAAISARRQMVAAMRAGNGEVAERVIRLHLHDTNQLLLKYEETLDPIT